MSTTPLFVDSTSIRVAQITSWINGLSTENREPDTDRKITLLQKLAHHPRFLNSLHFQRLSCQITSVVSDDHNTNKKKKVVDLDRVQNEIVFLEKPCDVRLDLPVDKKENNPERYHGNSNRHFKEEVTVEDWFRAEYQNSEIWDGKIRFVNQLDFATSGINVLAVTKKMGSVFQQEFQERRTIKIYEALVHGWVDLGDGEHRIIDVPICDDGLNFARKTCTINDPGAQSATTHVNVIQHGFLSSEAFVTEKEQKIPVTFVRVRILTGRRHQIRVHLHHLNHPIVGDGTYAKVGEKDMIPYRMFLHAASLELPSFGITVISPSHFGKEMIIKES